MRGNSGAKRRSDGSARSSRSIAVPRSICAWACTDLTDVIDDKEAVGHPSGMKEPPEQLGMAVPRRLAHHPVAPIIDLVERLQARPGDLSARLGTKIGAPSIGLWAALGNEL